MTKVNSKRAALKEMFAVVLIPFLTVLLYASLVRVFVSYPSLETAEAEERMPIYDLNK